MNTSPTRHFSWKFLLLSLAFLYLPARAAENPADYPYQIPLQIEEREEKATWYRLDIPMSVHAAASHADLRDLRVFNAAGEALPYALVPGRERVTQTRRVETARLFALHTHAAIGEEQGLRIRRTRENIHIEILPGKPASQTDVLSGWLLEVGEQDFPLERLRLDWEDGNWPEAAASFQRFDIEASDDLENWQGWGEGQIVHVGFGGEYIDQREIALPRRKARYLRLTWRTPQGILLKTAQVSGTRSGHVPAPLIWSEPIPGKRTGDDEFTWQLPRPLPLARVRIPVREVNTLAPVVLSGSLGQSAEIPPASSGKRRVRPREKPPVAVDPWRTLARGVLYRIRENGREAAQEELDLPEEAVRQLRLRLDPRGGGLGAEAPELRVALHGYQLIFLARGNPPYRLALGREDRLSAALPLTTLIPGYDERQPPAFGVARITEDAAISTVPPSPPTEPTPEQTTIDGKKTGLWAVLLLGVALLVGMAMSLLRSEGNIKK